MQMDRFTTLAQQVLATAQMTAVERANATLTPLHMRAAMLTDRAGITYSIIEKAGVQGERVQQIVASELEHLPTVTGDVGPPQTAPETIQVITAAEKLAREMGDSYVSTEHLLLALLDVKSGALLWKVRAAPDDRPEYRHLGNGRLVSYWPVRGGPVVSEDGKTVYFGSGLWPSMGVFVFAVDAETGSRIIGVIASIRGDRMNLLDETDAWAHVEQTPAGLARFLRKIMDDAHAQR